MPEGDTIWRTARTLERVLAGKPVVRFGSMLPAVAARAERLKLVGRVIERVEARGKHLLVQFAGGPVLHTHQGMRGSWRIQRTRGAEPLPRGRAVIDTGGSVAVCSLAPVVELLSASQASAHPALSRLGPDLLASAFDAAEARRRLMARAHEPIGVAVMDQTALAGIGNVYKSEVLFLCGVSPFAKVATLDVVTLDRIIATAATLLSRNLGSGMRRTTSALAPGPLWVYRRSGQPCRRCGALVGRIVQGEQVRSTYYCPSCQPA
jgi:endonuclease VIII